MTLRIRAAPLWRKLPGVARRILLEVLIHGAIPRAEIAVRLDLSRPTLTRVTKTLVDEGLLGGTELRSVMGRPSESLRSADPDEVVARIAGGGGHVPGHHRERVTVGGTALGTGSGRRDEHELLIRSD